MRYNCKFCSFENMNAEEIREYCLKKPEVTESFPFDDVTLVFKVQNKMFALVSLDGDLRISLKSTAEDAIELREQYPAIVPGYHLNKRLWNTVMVDNSLSPLFIQQLIDVSYALIVDSLPKKLKEDLKNKSNG